MSERYVTLGTDMIGDMGGKLLFNQVLLPKGKYRLVKDKESAYQYTIDVSGTSYGNLMDSNIKHVSFDKNRFEEHNMYSVFAEGKYFGEYDSITQVRSLSKGKKWDAVVYTPIVHEKWAYNDFVHQANK